VGRRNGRQEAGKRLELWVIDSIRIDKLGKSSVIYTDTYTGSALAANSKGQVFVAERSLGNALWMLKPRRKLIANTVNGEPFDCAGRFINDIVADSKGGVYMTMDGLYYVNPKGVVQGPFGSVPGNGLMLSPDEKIFYATGRLVSDSAGLAAADGIYNAGLVAYDVQADGSLVHERQVAELCGDGLAVDTDGRIYCTLARMPDPEGPVKTVSGIGVVSPEGKVLGIIPQPRPVVSLAFGGPDKKTLFAAVSRPIQIVSIPMVAQGNTMRPK
jgi:gluconolactonase